MICLSVIVIADNLLIVVSFCFRDIQSFSIVKTSQVISWPLFLITYITWNKFPNLIFFFVWLVANHLYSVCFVFCLNLYRWAVLWTNNGKFVLSKRSDLKFLIVAIIIFIENYWIHVLFILGTIKDHIFTNSWYESITNVLLCQKTHLKESKDVFNLIVKF